ncbi:GLPGLI family protein [Psychroflexus salinarum]|uniref:GLPGLI family protein n=1 Tax=Psychroflexus salinarum TaxID=546024 RepID=A0ABW3GPC8_9FLAO
MKPILSFFLYIFPFLLFSQNSVIVEYVQISETRYMKSNTKSILYANNDMAKQSHFKPQLNQEYEHGASMNENGEISIIEKPEESDINWFINPNKNEILKSVTKGNIQQIVYDSNLKYDWKITDEVDNIGNYQVIKAMTHFRGRTFIAWFAPSIPIGFGPWKLYGLPGLILRMYDEDKKFTWIVRKININVELPKSDLSPVIQNDATKMTYEEALEISRKQRNEKAKIRNTKLGGRGNSFKTVHHREENLERKYEWEKEN